jgi:hypothetical protein
MNVSKTLQILFCGVAAVGSVQAQALNMVRIDNTPSSPVVQRDAKSNYTRVQIQLNITPGQAVPQYTVPAGKMLVIEHAAFELVNGDATYADLKIVMGNWVKTYPILPQMHEKTAESTQQYAAVRYIYWGAEEGPFYAKSPWVVTAAAHYTGPSFMGGKVILSGYLRDADAPHVN